MAKKKQGYDVIGLIHPDSAWHKNQELIGCEIVVLEISESFLNPGWYMGKVILIDVPDDTYNCLADNMNIHGFRPRRMYR